MLFNIEFLTAVVFVGWWNLSGAPLYTLIGVLTICATTYWYWFMGWLFYWIKNRQVTQDTIKFSRDEVIPQVYGGENEGGIVNKIVLWFENRILKGHLNIDNNKDSKIFKFIKQLFYSGAKWTACLALFAISCFPTIWYPGMACVRAMKWKLGFSFIMCGNLVKNFGITKFIVIPLVEYIKTLF